MENRIDQSDKTKRIQELTKLLNAASKAYYDEDREIMSNFEYDSLYDELEQLEKETGYSEPDSPTRRVGYQPAVELVKEAHATPMLSLDKTKDPEALAVFIEGQKGLLSWKLDGLTVVLTYEKGRLIKAVTRGNGEIGEVITDNARTFVNLPKEIAYDGTLVVRGEAVIKYSDFERINREIPDADAKYKNPRNLCSGSVRQLDARVTASRSVNLFAFSLESAVDADGTPHDFGNSHENGFLWLKSLGFDVVAYKVVYSDTIVRAVEEFAHEIEGFDVPSDGLVLLMDDIEYGRNLGRTAKFPRNSIAFKWKDEIAETHLLEIEWSPSRTGLINPIAVFEPVELEGTTVSRASLHNISIIEGLKLGVGDTITVYKANMIIPQIAENLTEKGGLHIPDTCPACHGQTAVRNDNGVKTLVCENPDCPAKRIKSFANYVSRNCLNIDGISEETLEKFIGRGFLQDFADLYHLDRYRDEIVAMSGFGEKSYENIIASVNTSRQTTCARLLGGLGLPNVGRANSIMICKAFGNDFARVRHASRDELLEIEGVGDVIADSFTAFFADPMVNDLVDRILEEIELTDAGSSLMKEETLKGITFVITGSLNTYPNRDALKEEIESKGGKVAGSVSSKTSYLINNDITSQSGKNKTAKQLGIPVITEAEYVEKFGGK